MGRRPSALRLPTKPSAATLQPLQAPYHLGAVTEDGLTPVGEQMLRLPVHRLARMVIARPTATAAVIAALLDDGDIAIGRPDERPPISQNALKPCSIRREQHCASIVNEAAGCNNEAKSCRRAGIDFSLGALRQIPQVNFSPTHFLIASPANAGEASFNDLRLRSLDA